MFSMSKSQLSGVQTVLKRAICSPFFHCCPPQSIFHSAVRIGLWNLRSEYNTLLVNTFPLFAVSVRIKPEHCANSYRSRMTSSFFTSGEPRRILHWWLCTCCSFLPHTGPQTTAWPTPFQGFCLFRAGAGSFYMCMRKKVFG